MCTSNLIIGPISKSFHLHPSGPKLSCAPSAAAVPGALSSVWGLRSAAAAALPQVGGGGQCACARCQGRTTSAWAESACLLGRPERSLSHLAARLVPGQFSAWKGGVTQG